MIKSSIFLHYIVFWAYIHLLGTNIEYALHRFIMHNENSGIYGESHVTHHKHTDKDMNLIDKDKDDYKKLDAGENLIFGVEEVLPFTVVVCIFAFIFDYYYPVKLSKFFILGLPLIYTLYTWITWNSIHPYIHDRCGREFTIVSLPYDTTKYFAENNFFIKWLIENHRKHHIYKGKEKGNYNVTLPGADFLYNTYN